jgi:hypothetical protein
VTDQELVAALHGSLSRQLGMYTELREIMQKMLNTVILSGGDISGVLEGLKRKQEILERIAAARRKSASCEALWQQKKKALADSQAGPINKLLEQLTIVIKDFLDGEEQIKTYIARWQQASP